MALDFEALKKKLEKTESGGGGDITFWRPETGRNEVRVLPSKERDNNFYAEVGTRWNVGPDKRKVIVPVDWSQPCPVKEFTDRLKDSGDAEDEALAKKMRYSTRYFFNVIDTSLSEDDEKYGKVQVYEAPKTVFKDILTLLTDPDYNNLLDEDKGYNLTIEKKGSGMQTEYSVRPRKNESAIPSDSWESELVDIVKLATPKSYEERLAILEGKDSKGNNGGSDNAVTEDIAARVNSQKSQATTADPNPWANADTTPDPTPTEPATPPKSEPKPADAEESGDAVRDEIAALLNKRK